VNWKQAELIYVRLRIAKGRNRCYFTAEIVKPTVVVRTRVSKNNIAKAFSGVSSRLDGR
jgi:hypothetical protein